MRLELDHTDPDTQTALEQVRTPKFSHKATLAELVFSRLLAQGESLPHSFQEAGFGVGLTNSQCWTKGARLAKSQRVQERITWYKELINRRFDVREERVLGELAAIAFSDPADFVHPDGRPIMVHELPEHARAAVQSIDMGERPDGTVYMRLRLNDKLKALSQLVKIKNMEQAHQSASAPKIEIGLKQGKVYEEGE